jgi:tetratricopeptide (TPR) repeat protein
MKKFLSLALSSLFTVLAAAQQDNCSLYPDGSPRQRACYLYQSGCEEPQGSAASQELFDSAIAVCPDYALAYYEKSVPFLKRGQFHSWRKYMDVAVRLDPGAFAGNRGWCTMKFLRDYQSALADLLLCDSLRNHQPGYTGDGEYDIRMYIAICYRELGDPVKAIAVMENCIRDNEQHNLLGTWDYYHLGVTRFRSGDTEGALKDLKKQEEIYPRMADNLYYLALAYKASSNVTAALEQIRKARRYFLEGYSRWDPYTETPDEVYLDDIEKLLADLGGNR